MASVSKAYNIADLRLMAQQRLPKGLFEFVDRGTEDEVSLHHNRAIFERIRFRPRTLVDVSKRSQEITLFGQKQKMPVVIAPTGTAGLMWYRGEIELARAAAAAGIPFTLATGSTTAMERIAEEVGSIPLWFQLYMWPDRNLSHQLVERARAAGFKALVVTVDGAMSGNREYNLRNGFTIPFSFTRRNVTDVLMHPRWLLGVLARYATTTGMPRYENYPSEIKYRITARPMGRSMMRNDSLTWDDLRVLRKMWPNLLLVKGILHPQDAISAVDCGADGVIVSNHGGRNLDGIISPMEALPEIADAVGKRTTVLMDSGFRRGTDVVKALAMGAKAVQIGRSTLYGVAAGGEEGAARALAIFRDEIDRVLALIGCRNIAELTTEFLHAPDFPLRAADPGRPGLQLLAKVVER
ncbi:MAG: alpha-hydroxy-acid oxidizing enzyme [Betaproteobacteria bacterium RIFCSPLOWO2_02_FULL_67_26]|nr:MAG: alpha-hydroxy-acid oxidizing enzyme [Betaproteobacteria bacterium RIFCSPLOWO2_02_FULL_67_26]